MKPSNAVVQGRTSGAALHQIFAFLPPMSRSGVFIAEAENETVTIGIVDRHIVFTDTTAGRASERIGALLIADGKVDRRTIRIAIGRQRDERRKIGAMLVEAGNVSEDDLAHALEEQIRARIDRIRSWPSFAYRFCAVRLTGDTGVRVPIGDIFSRPPASPQSAADGPPPEERSPVLPPLPVDSWRFSD